MRVLFATTANDGHFGPLRPFARAFADAGHEVRVAAPALYAVALESAYLAPNAQVSLYPWKMSPIQIQIALRHVRAFLNTNRPAVAAPPLAAAAQ